MATKSYVFEIIEVLWIRKALDLQRRSLVRSIQKEVEGSEMLALRRKEIQVLDSLVGKL